jgi:hypothetical protein
MMKNNPAGLKIPESGFPLKMLRTPGEEGHCNVERKPDEGRKFLKRRAMPSGEG